MKTDELKINCVEMVRKIRDRNYQVTKKMSRTEKIKYIREKAAAVNKSLNVLTK
jgi:hypothetical protein